MSGGTIQIDVDDVEHHRCVWKSQGASQWTSPASDHCVSMELRLTVASGRKSKDIDTRLNLFSTHGKGGLLGAWSLMAVSAMKRRTAAGQVRPGRRQ